MSTIADNFIKDGSFGRRVLAMFASFYAVALLCGLHPEIGAASSGYENVASVLSAVGLDGAAQWVTDTFTGTLSANPVVLVAGVAALVSGAFGMAAAFRRGIVDVTPQASFAYLLALCLLIDLEHISLSSALLGTAVIAVTFGLFCLLPGDNTRVHPAVGALMMFIAPLVAVLYGPARVLGWLATESRKQTVPVALEHRTGPVRIGIVKSSEPTGARVV